MIRYIFRRIGWSIFVVWLVVSAVFVLMNTLGDPAVAQLGPKAQKVQIDAFRKKHGLNQPLWKRYAQLISRLGRGDLDKSFRTDIPVTQIMEQRLPRTLFLGSLSMSIELCVGVLLGIIAAVFRRRIPDHVVMAFSWITFSVPTFLAALFALNYFAFRLGWFPVGGFGTDTWDHMRHALLPALTLAVLGAATYARVMRNELLETLHTDYVRTARAKGLSYIEVLFRHAVRTAFLPVVAIAGLQFASLASGAIITETLFGWPGMGRLAVESIYTPDYPVLLGTVIVGCVFVQFGNLLSDLALAALDPRVRVTEESA